MRLNSSFFYYFSIKSATTWLPAGCPNFELLHDIVYVKVDVLFRWMDLQSIHYDAQERMSPSIQYSLDETTLTCTSP